MVVLDVVNATNAGVGQRACRPRFAFKALQQLRILDEAVRDEFQRDKAAEFGVFRLVNHAHTAAAETLENAVMRDGIANHRDCLEES